MVVVDSAPHALTDSRTAIRQGHLVLVPVQPSPMDLWATAPTLALAREERRPAMLVINRMPPRSTLATDMVEKLNALDAGVCRVALGNRTAYASSLGAGLGVTEAEPGSVAARELAAAGDDLLATLASLPPR
jgi:chromosome partitioning protein